MHEMAAELDRRTSPRTPATRRARRDDDARTFPARLGCDALGRIRGRYRVERVVRGDAWDDLDWGALRKPG